MNAVLKLQRGPHIVSAIEATYLLTIACIVINAIVVLWTRTLLLINVLCFIYIAYASSWWTLQFMLASTNLIRIMLRCGFIRYFAVTAAQIILQFFSTFFIMCYRTSTSNWCVFDGEYLFLCYGVLLDCLVCAVQLCLLLLLMCLCSCTSAVV